MRRQFSSSSQLAVDGAVVPQVDADVRELSTASLCGSKPSGGQRARVGFLLLAGALFLGVVVLAQNG